MPSAEILNTEQFCVTEMKQKAIDLLSALIEIPSPSKAEDKTADLLVDFFSQHGIKAERKFNNVWVKSKPFDPAKRTILLNSHHDTVAPNGNYTRNPYKAMIENDKLYGLGSNDAGASLVCLTLAFIAMHNEDLPFNLILAATAEEEISGKNGIGSVLPELGKIDLAIVGEPTGMQLAVAEKGLLVVDAVVTGVSSHAAHENNMNPVYIALGDIEWIKNFKFPDTSPLLGEVKMTVTVVEAGEQHNVVPAWCKYCIDIRTTEKYIHEEILTILRENLNATLTPRSLRLKASAIDMNHPVISAAKTIGIETFSSPTLSDQALIPFPSVKIGPGDSKRSHLADEFIYLNEIEQGINGYVQLLKKIYNHEN